MIRPDTWVPRGTVLHVEFGEGHKPEPTGPHYAVVVSANDLNRRANWTVLPFTTYGGQIAKIPEGLLNVRLRPREGGQPKVCDVLCFRAMTINKCRRGVKVIGRLPPVTLAKIDRGLSVALGLSEGTLNRASA